MTNNEGTTGYPVTGIDDAMHILSELGVEWTEVRRNRHLGRGWHGELRFSLGIHYYFYNKEGDNPAYYTPTMRTFTVFDRPRKCGVVGEREEVTHTNPKGVTSD